MLRSFAQGWLPKYSFDDGTVKYVPVKYVPVEDGYCNGDDYYYE